MPELLTIKEASEWATGHLNKMVTPSNISYLIQYGRIKKICNNGTTLIDKDELARYYQSSLNNRENKWKDILGNDLNWHLSFEQLKEAETTKHVHRFHPYKGKFIPQLVEHFLDAHTDEFKKEIYFKRGDIILDPFCGSGTTLVQCNELGMHSIGIDISEFNALISNVKIGNYNFLDLRKEILNITEALTKFTNNSKIIPFENSITEVLTKFNNRYFPVPDYKYALIRNEIDELVYGAEKEKEFLNSYQNLVKEHGIKINNDKSKDFLDRWYLKNIREEIDFVFNNIQKIKGSTTKEIMFVILSRTMRSCRATTHADLATLKEPITSTYYCAKHGKICKPLFTILGWWNRYCNDTIIRLGYFSKLKTNTYQKCIIGDARKINIVQELEKENTDFAKLVQTQKINGIFSSPPYVGLIDYHEQHAYAYNLFGFKRKDDMEIGPLFRGQGISARKLYIKGVSDVLNNCKRFLIDDYDIFLVANDKYNLYPIIASNSGMKIVNQFKRPVLNRTEKDKNAYSETIKGGDIMRTYEVVLTKSYIIRIKAENEKKAREYSELFTSDIQNISLIDDRKKFNFEIEEIDCKLNEAFEVQEEEYEKD